MAERAYEESEFRASNNKLLLKGLFFEMTLADKTGVRYTLKDEDHLGYPSLGRLYIEMEDPTEYNFAIAYLESWAHWEQLTACNWFKPFLERWRRELEVRLKSKALAEIKAEARSGGRNSFAANKYLLERGWEPKEGQSAKRGRPSKEEIKKAAEEHIQSIQSLDEDYNRITVN
jgi:hypothetical protein